ncbi:MAG: hypothetical protein FJ150_02040 [Euryarchaeota archaeon]|nr:hypothetical protein [Euryarchaeota archaeon]
MIDKKIIDPYRVSMWLGSAILIILAVYMIIWKTVDDFIAIMVLVGILIIVVNFLSYIGMEKPKDERLKKIGTLAATYSWYITLAFMCFLLFSGYYSHRVFKPAELFGLVIFVMISTMLVINECLNLKGDVE